MINISAVCGMGLGSGLLVKMGIERVLENGYTKRISCRSCRYIHSPLYEPDIYGQHLSSQLFKRCQAEVIVVKNLFNEFEESYRYLQAY